MMIRKIDKFFLVIVLVIILSIIYTSYKTLVEKDFIIIEPEEDII